MAQCIGILKNGKSCGYKARSSMKTCKVHENQESANIIDKPKILNKNKRICINNEISDDEIKISKINEIDKISENKIDDEVDEIEISDNEISEIEVDEIDEIEISDDEIDEIEISENEEINNEIYENKNEIKKINNEIKNNNMPIWQQFEFEAINHFSFYNNSDYVWHWSNVPEIELYNCGYINNFNQYRLARLIAKNTDNIINRLKDYGIDGLAKDGDNTYHAIQAKHYTDKRVCANDIGSFVVALMFGLKIKNSLNQGYLYHTSDLQIDLKHYIENSNNAIVPIHMPLIKEEEITEIKTFELYDYQKQALEAMINWEYQTGLLNMPCGTGKTVVLRAYLEEMLFNTIIVLSPTRILTKQNYERLLLDGYKCVLIDSDSDATRDVEYLQEILNTNERVFLCATYKSIDVIKELRFIHEDAILCIDECHKTTKEVKIYQGIFEGKIISISATPAKYLDDEVIYKMTYAEAISNGYICDYKVFIPLITDIKSNIEIDLKEFNHNADILIKAEFIATGMKREGFRRCIVYLSTTERCKEFSAAILTIFNKYHGEKAWAGDIVHKDKHKDREEKLKEFQSLENPETFRILISVRILNEGIDIPRCDSIYFADPPTDSNDIVLRSTIQRASRSNRLDSLNPNKCAGIFAFCTEYSQLAYILEYIKSNDIKFKDKLQCITRNYDRMMKPDTVIEEAKEAIDIKNYVIGLKNIDDAWTIKYNNLLNYIEEYGKLPVRSTYYNEFPIGRWVDNQLTVERNDKILPERKEKLEEISIWKWREKVKYEDKINFVKLYYEEHNGKSPKQGKVYNNFLIERFCKNIRTAYNNGNLDADIQKEFESIPGWLWSINDAKMNQKYDLLLKFTDLHGCPPIKGQRFENLPIGDYYQNIKTSYTKGTLNNKDIKRFSALNGWKWSKKIPTWDASYAILLLFIEKYNRFPEQVAKYKDNNIGIWCMTQRRNRNKLTDEQKKQLEAVKGWYW